MTFSLQMMQVIDLLGVVDWEFGRRVAWHEACHSRETHLCGGGQDRVGHGWADAVGRRGGV